MNNTVHLFFNGQQLGPMFWDEAVHRCSQDDTPADAQVLIDKSSRISAQEFLAMNLRRYAQEFPNFFDQSSRDYWVRYDGIDKGPLLLREWIDFLCANNAPLTAEFKAGDLPHTPLIDTLKAWAGGYLEKIKCSNDRSQSPANGSLLKTALAWILPETKILRTAVAILYIASPIFYLVSRSLFQDGTAALIGANSRRVELVAEKEALERHDQKSGIFSKRDHSAAKAEISRKLKETEDQMDLIRNARMPWIQYFGTTAYLGLTVFCVMVGRRLMK